MKRYRLKRIPITSESYMEVDMMNGKWVQLDDLAELNRKLDALRNEVKAARFLGDASPLALEYCKQQWLDARDVTDTMNALEDEL